jgi:hypothetical protein
MTQQDESAAPMETEEVVKKKRTKKFSVPFAPTVPDTEEQRVQAMYEQECEMELQDRIQVCCWAGIMGSWPRLAGCKVL